MAPHEIRCAIPRRHRTQRPMLLFLGGFFFLTLCWFTSHFPGMRQLTSMRPFGPSMLPQKDPDMTSWTAETAPVPHHDPQAAGGASEVQVPLGDEGDPEVPDSGDFQDYPKMAYGTNKHPPLRDDPPTLIQELAPEHVPRYSAPSTETPGGRQRPGRRLVVVGDVHGNAAALKALLRKLNFDNRNGDHLVLVGDMITKGPDNRGVVQLAMQLGASAVRGNHEDRVLAAAREMHRISADAWSGADGRDGEEDQGNDEGDGEGEGNTDTVLSDNDEGDEAEAYRKKDHARKVAKSLSRAQLSWLRSLPVILRIPRLPDAKLPPFNAGTIAVVHAGLVPGVPLEKQDPWAVMNMRSLVYPRTNKGKQAGTDGGVETYDNEESDVEIDAVAVPVDGRNGEPWSHAWNRYQNHPSIHPSQRTLVIYGHDAKAGLQADLHVDITPPNATGKDKKKKKQKQKQKPTGLRYAFGLDSGCGHGRQLSALVIEAVAAVSNSGSKEDGEGEGGVLWRVEQVECS